jgi:hypothetical protein
MWAGWLDAKLVELPPEQAARAVTCRRFTEQWSKSNPRFRRRTPSRAISNERKLRR